MIVEASGPKPPTLSAETMGKEYDADAKAFKDHHERRWMFLTGTVASKEMKGEFVRVIFKTDSKIKVAVFFDPMEEADANQIKVGGKIRVLGQFGTRGVEPGQVLMGNGLYLGEEK